MSWKAFPPLVIVIAVIIITMLRITTQAKHRWALSGTPIQNQVQELFSYFHFLQYHPFNTQAAFRQYMRNIEDLPNPTHALERLREMLQPVMLRRTKESRFDGVKILTLPARWVTYNASCSPAFVCHGMQEGWLKLRGQKQEMNVAATLLLCSRCKQA